MENFVFLICVLFECVVIVGEGVKDSFFIVISYFLVVFVFGFNVIWLGFILLESLFFFCIIYVGVSQFVIIVMLVVGSLLWVVVLMVMVMDVCYVLYGFLLCSCICLVLDKKKIVFWVFGLIDEVFVVVIVRLVCDNCCWSENWMFGFVFILWVLWVCGMLVGVWFGNGLLVDYLVVEVVFGFMLLVLFMSFLLVFFQCQQLFCVMVVLVGVLGGILLFFILVVIFVGIVCGCLMVLFQVMFKGMLDEQ